MAHTPYGESALLMLAFAESSFFPLPPDILLLALCLALPVRSYRYAFLCTAVSVAGGDFRLYNRLRFLDFNGSLLLQVCARSYAAGF